MLFHAKILKSFEFNLWFLPVLFKANSKRVPKASFADQTHSVSMAAVLQVHFNSGAYVKRLEFSHCLCETRVFGVAQATLQPPSSALDHNKSNACFSCRGKYVGHSPVERYKERWLQLLLVAEKDNSSNSLAASHQRCKSDRTHMPHIWCEWGLATLSPLISIVQQKANERYFLKVALQMSY